MAAPTASTCCGAYAAGATRWLRPGGHLLVETTAEQALTALTIFTRHGMTARTATSDELEATVIVGTRPPRRRRSVG